MPLGAELSAFHSASVTENASTNSPVLAVYAICPTIISLMRDEDYSNKRERLQRG